MKFYKGVLISHLNNNYVPGTVTTNFQIAFTWMNRISSNKRNGASRHVAHGKACIVEIEFDGKIHHHDYFQKPGITEHKRPNCWTSAAKDKAQINDVCKYRVLSDSEIDNLYKP
jgi:hypothetical protein